ncbi:50S ribosomal protein L16 [Candidatus Gracilibacteria bacterium]|nr:50S ribosomal protein L16 [Candidatus Gracilibacteria bacterium]
MLQPAKTKFRKWHRMRGSQYGVATSGTTLAFGSYGLKSMDGGEITSRQIEAARKAMAHCFKRGGKIWIRIYPHKPITKKAAEVPMGSGKGTVELYVAAIKRGHMLFEIDGVDLALAKRAMYLAASKLPVKTRLVMSR